MKRDPSHNLISVGNGSSDRSFHQSTYSTKDGAKECRCFYIELSKHGNAV